MKYHLTISGGYLGKIQEYEGKLVLADQKASSLKEILNESTFNEVNENVRDSFVYNFRLELDKKVYKITFDDATIPANFRSLVEEIKKN